MTTTSSTAAAAESTTTNAVAETENSGESIITRSPPVFNLHEYFQPVFDEVDNLNKMLDSHMEEEKDKAREKKKKEKD
jgi:transcription elongation factor Elf1